ncbi:MAG: phosphoserine phosphatase [Actinomycetota bacterium]|jgi:phosphoserine phosphatase|nr:phosphoserine phosphatase [Actinomycetota bacterium]
MAEPTGIVAFDLDGTLLPDTTVCLHLAPWVGHDGMAELERQYAEGRITNAEVAERDAIFYKGRRRHDVCRQLENLEFIDGLPETIKWLKGRSLVPVIATITWRLAAEFVRDRFGFAAASGCEIEQTDDGIIQGVVSRHFDAANKVGFVQDIAAGLGLSLQNVVAIGDSTSDIPLFRAAGLAIALNASDNAREVADLEFETRDLRDLIPAIDRYFSTAPLS